MSPLNVVALTCLLGLAAAYGGRMKRQTLPDPCEAQCDFDRPTASCKTCYEQYCASRGAADMECQAQRSCVANWGPCMGGSDWESQACIAFDDCFCARAPASEYCTDGPPPPGY